MPSSPLLLLLLLPLLILQQGVAGQKSVPCRRCGVAPPTPPTPHVARCWERCIDPACTAVSYNNATWECLLHTDCDAPLQAPCEWSILEETAAPQEEEEDVRWPPPKISYRPTAEGAEVTIAEGGTSLPAGHVVWYTLDGNWTDRRRYSEPFIVSAPGADVSAVVEAPGRHRSPEAVEAIPVTPQLPPPLFSLLQPEQPVGAELTLSPDPSYPEAAVSFALCNGSVCSGEPAHPYAVSIVFSSPGAWTVAASSSLDGYPPSPVVSRTYTVFHACPGVTFTSPLPGRVTPPVPVVAVPESAFPGLEVAVTVFKEGAVPSTGTVVPDGSALQDVGNYTIVAQATNPGGCTAGGKATVVVVVVPTPRVLMVRVPAEEDPLQALGRLADGLGVARSRVVFHGREKDPDGDAYDTVLLSMSFSLGETSYRTEVSAETLTDTLLSFPSKTLEGFGVDGVWVQGAPPPPLSRPEDDDGFPVWGFILIIGVIVVGCIASLYFMHASSSSSSSSSSPEPPGRSSSPADSREMEPQGDYQPHRDKETPLPVPLPRPWATPTKDAAVGPDEGDVDSVDVKRKERKKKQKKEKEKEREREKEEGPPPSNPPPVGGGGSVFPVYPHPHPPPVWASTSAHQPLPPYHPPYQPPLSSATPLDPHSPLHYSDSFIDHRDFSELFQKV